MLGSSADNASSSISRPAAARRATATALPRAWAHGRSHHSVALLVLALLVLVALTPCFDSAAQASSPLGAAPAVPGQLIITFQPATPRAVRERIVTTNGGTVIDQIAALDAVVATFSTIVEQPDTEVTQRLLSRLGQEPAVADVEPNRIYRLAAVPNDSLQAQQWAWTTVEAYGAWEITQGSSAVTIAVVDTGVQLDHPDLDGKLLPGYDYVDGDAVPEDGNGHGTHVAGTAAAETDNALGGAGTCPACRILPVRVLDNNGSGTLAGVAQGITYAADQGARVINLSLGGDGAPTVERAVNYAWKKGAFLACAAGNDNTSSTTLAYPAAYPTCFAVAASTSSDIRASFSNYGTWVEVAAPGTSIVSTWTGSSYGGLSGSSMAAPHVAGLAGLLASQGLTNTQIRDRICATADTIAGTGTEWICGRINAYRALGGTNTPSPVAESPINDNPVPSFPIFLPSVMIE